MERREFLKNLSFVFSSLFLSSSLFSAGCERKIKLFGGKKMFDRVIVLGIDGIDPNLTDRFISGGDLPSMKMLSETGAYSRLATSNPPQSPVAWSNIGTGTNAGSHDVFDFILRHPKKYLPDLSVLRPNRQNIFGARDKMFEETCKSKFFWEYTADHGIPSVSIRWPMTFPPRTGESIVLSGLGVPDVKGGLGRYTFFSSSEPDRSKEGWEKVKKLRFNGETSDTEIGGPYVMGISGKKESTIPLKIRKVDRNTIRLEVSGKTFDVKAGQWSDWVEMDFSGGALKKVSATGRFYLVSADGDVNIYLTPLQVNPKDPCFIISNPDGYAARLSDEIGSPYYTLGIPEDTKPLTEDMIDDDAFISMCDDIMTEREKMLRYGLSNFKDGVFAFVIDTTDRIQHIYWRLEDKGHPLYNEAEDKKYGNVIRDYYKWTDRLIGEVVSNHIDDRTLLLICSDHGFTTFRKSFHLNRWLAEKGYMALKGEPDPEDHEGGALFRHVDWGKTAAYSLGFSSIYLNLAGREGKGIVDLDEAKKLKKKIASDLKSFIDPETGEKAIRDVYFADDIYSKKYLEDSPDLVVGFESGYRMSWQTAIGGTPSGLLEPNLKKWSGDHIMDPSIVPGVFFSNHKIKKKSPRGIDIAPTVLGAFGIKGEKEIEGEELI